MKTLQIIGIIAALIILITAPQLAGGIFAALVIAGIFYGLAIGFMKLFSTQK